MSRLRRSILPGAVLLSLVAPAFLAAAAHAQPQPVRVVVVDDFGLDDIAALENRGAVGLLVPGAGPRVSEAAAMAGLERGVTRSSFRGGLPSGRRVIRAERASEIPTGPVIVLGLPEGGDQPNDRRYPVAVLDTGLRGLLDSPTTRIPGLVSIVDIVPTAVGNAEDTLRSQPDPDPA